MQSFPKQSQACTRFERKRVAWVWGGSRWLFRPDDPAQYLRADSEPIFPGPCSRERCASATGRGPPVQLYRTPPEDNLGRAVTEPLTPRKFQKHTDKQPKAVHWAMQATPEQAVPWPTCIPRPRLPAQISVWGGFSVGSWHQNRPSILPLRNWYN